MALLIAIPALLLPQVASDASQIVVLAALLAGVMTFVEYNSNAPSIVEFRDAPPSTACAISALFLTVFLLTAIMKGKVEPTLMTQTLTSKIGHHYRERNRLPLFAGAHDRADAALRRQRRNCRQCAHMRLDWPI